MATNSGPTADEVEALGLRRRGSFTVEPGDVRVVVTGDVSIRAENDGADAVEVVLWDSPNGPQVSASRPIAIDVAYST